MAKKQSLPTQLNLFSMMNFVVVDPAAAFNVGLLSAQIDQSASMIRYCAVDPKTVFDELNRRPTIAPAYEEWNLCSVRAMVTPRRLQTFQDNTKCVCCGRVGNVFLVEQHTNELQRTQYINLYCSDDSGLTLMTVDHILPDSMGGRSHPDNYQTMCKTCNGQKSNMMSQDEIDKVRKNIRQYAKSWVDSDFLNLLLDIQEIINKEKKGSKDWTALMTIFNEHRRRVKHATTKTGVQQAVINLRRVLDNYFNPTHGSVQHKLTMWVNQQHFKVVRTTAKIIRNAGDWLVKVSKRLNKTVVKV